jgi:hypothetical protein
MAFVGNYLVTKPLKQATFAPWKRSLVSEAQFVHAPGRIPLAEKFTVWISPGVPGIETTLTSLPALTGVPTPSTYQF